MSTGFQRHGAFKLIGAVDLEVGKPCEGVGKLGCNGTYELNTGLKPIAADLRKLSPSSLRRRLERIHGKAWDGSLDVLISCAPCTGFSRVQASNHLSDDPRNGLVGRSAAFVKEFQPSVFLMENARELVMGRFRHHFERLRTSLEKLNYRVSADVHFLNCFGLPQSRERALVVAVRKPLALRTIEDLWDGYSVRAEATTVRSAIKNLPRLEAGAVDPNDPMHRCPAFANPTSIDRLRAIPHDGGTWSDLVHHEDADRLMTPAMKRSAGRGDFGSHPDVYGRLWWDRPAVTIKRECSHAGNGRYSHPDQDRMLSVREMAILQGFPRDYVFASEGVSNMYRHIGDAVPPLVSFQLAHLAAWILGGEKPRAQELIMRDTHLSYEDVVCDVEPPQLRLAIGD